MYANRSKNNTGKVLATILVMAMVVAGAAVLFSDESTAAPTNTQQYSGTLDSYQPFAEGTNVIINDDLTITENGVMNVSGGNFTIKEGVDVVIEDGGQLIIEDAFVTINGTVTVTGSGANTTKEAVDVEGDVSLLQITGTATQEVIPSFKTSGVVINNSVTVTKGAAFNATDGSVLINNNGSLNVTRSGSNVGSMSGLTVYLAVGGTFNFNGLATGDVNVSTYGNGTVFTTGSAIINPEKTVTSTKNSSDLTFTNSSSSYNSYYVDANEVATQSIRQYALNVSGTVANMDDLKLSGGIYQTATDGTVSANTTQYYTSENAAKQALANKTVFYYNDKVMGNVIIDGTLTVQSASGFTVNDSAYLQVAGTLTIRNTTAQDVADLTTGAEANDEDIIDKVLINGIVEVTGTMTTNADAIYLSGDNISTGTLAVNGGTVTVNDFSAFITGYLGFYGAFYVDEDDVAHISDLADAIIGAAAATDVEEVQVWGTYGSNSADDGYGSYVISEDMTVPANITVYIGSGLIIENGVTVTFDLDSSVDFEDNLGKVFVDGKLVDKSLEFEAYEVTGEMRFEVKSVSEDELTNTYTSLATALAETTSGTIYLYDSVTIDGTMTIGENVTVQYADDSDIADDKKNAGINFNDEDAVLVINGTLYLSGVSGTTHTITTAAEEGGYGTVTVNNILRYDVQTAVTGDIAGAYFQAEIGDYDLSYYITSVAYAAQNSASVTDKIDIKGAISMGDVTFTQGEEAYNGLAVNIVKFTADKSAATGDVTLVGNVKFDTTAGIFTGSVQSDVTAGTSVVDFDKVIGAIVGYDSEEGVETTSTYMTLTAGASGSEGVVTITSGSVNVIGEDVSFEKIAVAAGATMNVPAGAVVTTTSPFMGEILDYLAGAVSGDDDAQKAAIKTLFNGLGIDNDLPVITDARMQTLAGLVADGNIVVEGELGALVAYIDGTVSFAKDSTSDILLGQINGTVTSEDGSKSGYTVAIVNGTLSGEYTAVATLAYPGSDITGALINSVDGETSTDDSTTIYVNGAEYATAYVQQDSDLPVMAILMFTDIAGVDIDTAKFYTDAEMTNQISNMDAAAVAKAYSNLIDAMRNGTGGNTALEAFIASFTGATVGDYDRVFISMEPSKVTGTITVYNGMNLYIDGKAIENFMVYNDDTKSYDYVLTVGTHQFSVQVNPGLSGTPVVTLDGQTVTGSFTIADNAQSFQIVVTGDISQDATIIEGGNGGDDGMGLTDILLIILVVLIVIMAIMVAMRLMRS